MILEEKKPEKINKRKLTLSDDNSQGDDTSNNRLVKKIKLDNVQRKSPNVVKQVNDILSGKKKDNPKTKPKLTIPSSSSSSSSSSSEDSSEDSIERMKSNFRKKNQEKEIAQTEMKINLNMKDVSVDKQLDALGIKSTALQRLKKFQRNDEYG